MTVGAGAQEDFASTAAAFVTTGAAGAAEEAPTGALEAAGATDEAEATGGAEEAAATGAADEPAARGAASDPKARKPGEPKAKL